MKDGRFEIPGCDPEKPVTFYFLDLKDQLGATVELSGKSAAGGPVTVRLQPTATARVLLKDTGGRPLAGHEARNGLGGLRLVITPGPDFGDQRRSRHDPQRRRVPGEPRPRSATAACAVAPTAA